MAMMNDARFAVRSSSVGCTLLLSRATSMKRKALLFGVPAIAFAIALTLGNGYLRAAAFVVQAAGMQGYARAAASLETGQFDERRLTIPWRGGELRARLYLPR